ncbi:MAG: hypothetical protein IT161_09965 [Bryobacterales bacterium]|nr:hypothetical protein [Bryobacterales bacterium]
MFRLPVVLNDGPTSKNGVNGEIWKRYLAKTGNCQVTVGPSNSIRSLR